MTEPHIASVPQLRVALTTANFDRLVEFYCIGLGLSQRRRGRTMETAV